MLTPRTIKNSLAGKSFTIRREGTTESVEFEFPKYFDAWPRRGTEAILAPLVCKHPTEGEIPSIIKFFDYDLPERAIRHSHLVRYGLAGAHEWLYEGVPYAWVDKPLEGHRIYGHVTKHALHHGKGDDFRIVRDMNLIDEFSEDHRRDLAAQLCAAIIGLEKLSIVHSDLSPANIIVGMFSSDDARCILIDYDGFQSPSVPKLPRSFGGNQIRMMGSNGYQHPRLMQRISIDDGSDDNLFVQNDRFALGVLCFELMVWTSQISNNLDRTHLLDVDELIKGRLRIPPATRGAWPEGQKLLEEAVKAQDELSLPSPKDWLKALGFLGAQWQPLRSE